MSLLQIGIGFRIRRSAPPAGSGTAVTGRSRDGAECHIDGGSRESGSK
ncbi:hypothetical protein [Streptomyces rimosus]|nr:hypothetical protein [Streptomyces rimosus]